MNLLDKQGLPVNDNWQYPSAEDTVAEPQRSAVRFENWAEQGASAAGVWVTGEEDPVAVAALLPQLKLVVIEFPKSRDGRGFTLARTLREHYGFTGDIRAAGPLLPDQVDSILGCGFSSWFGPANVPVNRWREAADAVALQATSKPKTLFERLSRARAAA